MISPRSSVLLRCACLQDYERETHARTHAHNQPPPKKKKKHTQQQPTNQPTNRPTNKQKTMLNVHRNLIGLFDTGGRVGVVAVMSLVQIVALALCKCPNALWKRKLSLQCDLFHWLFLVLGLSQTDRHFRIPCRRPLPCRTVHRPVRLSESSLH